MATSFKSRYNSRSNYSSTPTPNSNSESESSSGFWILAILLIILIIAAIMTGTFYKKYENFTDIKVKSYTLQYYCMERCGHCKDFEETIWNKFSNKINNNPGNYYFDTVKYDITDNAKGSELGKKYNINSTPTILLYNKNTERLSTFNDDRTEEKLLEFANRIIKSDNPDWKF
jgi:hypothetical protein